MSRTASVFLDDSNTKDIAAFAHDLAAIFQATLLSNEGFALPVAAKRCPWRFWLRVDDTLSLVCDICVWDDEDKDYFPTKKYPYHLDIDARGYNPEEYEQATIQCGQFVFDKLKAIGRYSRLLLVLDYGPVIDEFDANSE